MTCFLIRGCITLPKREQHRSPQECRTPKAFWSGLPDASTLGGGGVVRHEHGLGLERHHYGLKPGAWGDFIPEKKSARSKPGSQFRRSVGRHVPTAHLVLARKLTRRIKKKTIRYLHKTMITIPQHPLVGYFGLSGVNLSCLLTGS